MSVAACSGLLPASAAAEQPGAGSGAEAPTAEHLFRDARALIARKDYAAACPKLEESLRLDPAPGTEFNLARCYELEGRLASATHAYLHVADAMRAAHEPDREKVARARAAEITPRLSFLALAFPASPASASDTRLTLDGRELTRAEQTAPLAVDAGDHTLAVTASGKRPWQTSVHVEPGVRMIPVNVPLLEDDPAPAPLVVVPPASIPSPIPDAIAPPSAPATEPSPEASATPAARPGLGAQRVTAIGLVGAAVVAAGVGTYFGVRAFQLKDDAPPGCRTAACSSSFADSRTDGDISTVSFVACGALAVSGAILWLTAPGRSHGTSVTGAPSAGRVVLAPGTSLRSALWISGEF